MAVRFYHSSVSKRREKCQSKCGKHPVRCLCWVCALSHAHTHTHINTDDSRANIFTLWMKLLVHSDRSIVDRKTHCEAKTDTPKWIIQEQQAHSDDRQMAHQLNEEWFECINGRCEATHVENTMENAFQSSHIVFIFCFLFFSGTGRAGERMRWGKAIAKQFEIHLIDCKFIFVFSHSHSQKLSDRFWCETLKNDVSDRDSSVFSFFHFVYTVSHRATTTDFGQAEKWKRTKKKSKWRKTIKKRVCRNERTNEKSSSKTEQRRIY